jgi:Na+-transporting NADH:ubiquinone oxidoreductase subunit F
MDYTVVIASIVVFLTITFMLVGMLLGAKAKLLPSGPVSLQINGDNKVEVSSGSTLLSTLGNNKIFLPSACGGGGTCIQCKCKVLDGGGEILPTETPHFSRKEVAEGWRLGCQVKVKQDMVIQVPEEVFGIKKYEAKVIRNWNVASFIKEFVVEIPEEMDYKAGGYIQIEIPKCEVKYEDIDISAHPEEHPGEPDKFKLEWDKFKLWPLKMKNPETVERAYSMASFQASYIFSKRAGDKVTISGPYGEFFINESDSEMLYVGGGAGMAPMRSHLYELFRTLKTGRKVTFWYGGRSKRELFYIDHFRALEKDYPNFKFYIALSEPMEEDNWKEKTSLNSDGDGFNGFVHQVVIDHYLNDHEAPEDIEVYFCGPPLMNQAVELMAEDFGVPPENVRFDDFGG